VLPLSPRELRRLMKRFGVNVEEVKGVKSVTLTFEDKEVVIREPQIIVMNVQGQKIYQIVATSEEVIEGTKEIAEKVSFSEDDINFVIEQTGVSRDEAIKALREAGGDIAKAILLLTERKS